MKEHNLLISLGIIIYIITSGIDKFVYEIPNYIYIPLAIIGIALMIAGYIKDNNKK